MNEILKHLCVVVKVRGNEKFIITAYFTDKIKKVMLYRKRSKDMVWPGRRFLRNSFWKKAGYFRETENDTIMEKIDSEGNIIGFSILKVSAIRKKPITLALKNKVA